MDIGRNVPCPCGSGKKFKRCCGLVSLADPMETAAKVWRTAQDSVEQKALRVLRQVAGEASLRRASDDFGLADSGPHTDGPENQLFIPWLLYDWRADAFEHRGPAEDTIPFARRYLVEHDKRLDARERIFLDSASTTPTSFHEILSVEPGRSLRLRDIILGTEQTAFERSGSRYLHEGDLTYARVVALDDVALIVGCGSMILPPGEKGTILDLRASLRKSFHSVTADLLRRIEPQLRELYFAIRGRLLAPPDLRNTDGDPLEFHTLKYRVESADVAFGILRSLAGGIEREELMRDVTLLPDGRIRKAAFSWLKPGNKLHSSWDTTVLGKIEISERDVSVEVNSAKRAKLIRAQIAKRLGERATFLSDETKSLDGMLVEEERRANTPEGTRALKEHEAFQQRPEVQEFMRQSMEEHWESWVDEKIPALGGKTPRKAVRDPDGRERVEALLLQFERHDAGRQRSYDFDRVRERLGLPTRRRPHPTTSDTQ